MNFSSLNLSFSTLSLELARLLGNELCIVEVVDAHSTTYVGKCVGCYGTGGLATLSKDLEYGRDILLPFLAALTDRSEQLFEDGIEELLYLHVAQSTTLVVCLQFVEAAIVGLVLGKVFGLAEGIEVGEHRVALDLAWILHANVVRIGIHAHDAFAYLLR